jgi:hypothetical protein
MISFDILRNFRAWFAEAGLEGVFDWVAERGLRLQEFTALLGVNGDGSGLKQALAAHDEAESSPYAQVPGLHNLRWILFTPELKNPGDDSSAAESPAPAGYALILSFVFEGDAHDALDALLEHASVEPILCHCRGFRDGDDPAKYLMKHRIESGYMFRDLGPLRPHDRYTPDATISEIVDARAVERSFEEFYAAHSNASDLREKFLKEFDAGGVRLPLTPFERRLPDEARWARRASQLIMRLQDQAARRDPKKLKRRGVHAKAHGLIRASFEVLELPLEYRIGIFANPGEQFAAHLRPSNGAHMVQADGARDARGLAMSLEVPMGDVPNARTRKEFLDLPDDMPLGRQDFVLMSHPTFFPAIFAAWPCS